MVPPLRTIPSLLVVLASSCIQAPAGEVDTGAIDTLRILPSQPAELTSALLSEGPAGGPTLSEARAAVCQAVLANGWLRRAPNLQDPFLQSCASLEMLSDRKVVSQTNYDVFAIPRVMGWHLHVEVAGRGWDVSLRRESYAPKKEAWGDPASRDLAHGREVWTADVESEYDAQEATTSRDAVRPLIGEKLARLGINAVAVEPTPILRVESAAQILSRTQEGAQPLRLASTERLDRSGRILGYILALEDPNRDSSDDLRGVKLYYDAVGHYVGEADWPRI